MLTEDFRIIVMNPSPPALSLGEGVLKAGEGAVSI